MRSPGMTGLASLLSPSWSPSIFDTQEAITFDLDAKGKEGQYGGLRAKGQFVLVPTCTLTFRGK